MMPSIPVVDLSDPAFKADPYPYYAQLRAEAPVFRAQLPNGEPVWLLTRYDDVLAALKDPETFTNDRKLAMTPEQLKKTPWMPPIMRRFGRTLLGIDGEEHTRLRGLVHKAFTPRLVERMRGNVETLAGDLIGAAERRGHMDIIKDYALPIPLTIIAQILGVPTRDQPKFHRWSRTIMALSSTRNRLMAVPTFMAMTGYLRQLFKQRVADPQDDLITALVQAEIDGDRMDEDELLSMVFLLLLAGHETTVNLIGSGTLALIEHPEQLRMLRENPELARGAIEELVRFCNPVEQSTKRYARRDVTLHGVTIARGEMALLVLASANRDGDEFPEPDQLDITREDNHHLGFGMGVHYCVGAPLARLEGQIALTMLTQRLPGLRLGVPAERLRWNSGITVRGLQALPVAV